MISQQEISPQDSADFPSLCGNSIRLQHREYIRRIILRFIPFRCFEDAGFNLEDLRHRRENEQDIRTIR